MSGEKLSRAAALAEGDLRRHRPLGLGWVRRHLRSIGRLP